MIRILGISICFQGTIIENICSNFTVDLHLLSAVVTWSYRCAYCKWERDGNITRTLFLYICGVYPGKSSLDSTVWSPPCRGSLVSYVGTAWTPIVNERGTAISPGLNLFLSLGSTQVGKFLKSSFFKALILMQALTSGPICFDSYDCFINRLKGL